MQGPTHRDGGTAAALGGFLALGSASVTVIHPLIGLAVMYPFAVWASTAPDLDHDPGSVWADLKPGKKSKGQSIPSKDIVSRSISYVLHLGKPFRGKPGMGFASLLDCKHRSWQTHSEIPLLAVFGLLYWFSTGVTGFNAAELAILTWIVWGLGYGFFAHLVLDLLTPEGLPFATGMLLNKILHTSIFPKKIKIIPHVPPTEHGKPGFFSTGGTWEAIVFWVLRLVNLGLLGYIIYQVFFL